MFAAAPDDVCVRLKLPSNAAVVHVSANTYPQLAMPAAVTVSDTKRSCEAKNRGLGPKDCC